MAVGVLGGGFYAPGSSGTAYTVPAGISYAVVHAYSSGPCSVTIGGIGSGSAVSAVVGTGQSIGGVNSNNPTSTAPAGSVVVTGYEVP